jgi:FAD/FMN-containing dehydrogenase/Fe-S oxidoreductase
MSAAPELPHRVLERTPSTGRITREFIAIPEETIEQLRQALEKEIEGEVRFSLADRALYATDASNYRQLPYGVVLPKSAEDAVTTVRLCNRYDVPVTPRGGGTALAGQTCNSAVIIDFSKYMHRLLSLDPEKRLATVEPGCILDHLRDAAEKYELTFGPDPSTHDHNTLGGMIGNDSCGVHSIMAGRTADNVHSLDVLTYDGLRMTIGPTPPEEFARIVAAGGRRAEIYRAMAAFWKKHGHHFRQVYPDIPRRVSGYENLDQLEPEKGFQVARALTGTEATCVIVLGATLNLVHSPPERVLLIVGFGDIFAAADAVPELLTFGPIGLEAIDHLLTEYMKIKHFRVKELKLLPEGRAWLINEFGGETVEEAKGKAQKLAEAMKARGHAVSLVTDKKQQKDVWKVREASLAVTAHVPGEGPTWPGWEDSAVRRDDLGGYLRELIALFHKHGYEASVYGHFGDGLVHCRINFKLHTEEGLANWKRFLEEAADLVVRYGGTLSGEHGDGEARAALLVRMYGPDLMRAQREFRAIWDPRERMNPGKVLDPYPITANLRVGPSYHPMQVKGHFAYPEDNSFTQATLRCVGVGECRRRHTDGGVMCPSYLGTNEEKHSTRGRARLLFEMLRGDSIKGGFANDEVEDALDLCLACKGCKRDCPVQTDMATYKSEFRSHHYAKRWRPRSAYSMGLIHRWAGMASHAPWLANLVLRTPGIANLAKSAGGIAQARTIPPFASPTFRQWHAKNAKRNGGERVILWPDTFNNYFRADTAIAATRLLERLGFQVEIPSRVLCCGRPLYDWGWIDQAKALWRETLGELRSGIDAGVPVIGLEPACTSAFRDELPALFPNDPLATALSKQTRFLSEFLTERGITPPVSTRSSKALVQLHCHHHAVLDEDAERKLLDALPLDCEVLNTGCCGMAGSFGFEAEKYDISLTIAEKGMLPKIRSCSRDTLIVANGFSCREQIEQLTGRKTLHLAQLLEVQG